MLRSKFQRSSRPLRLQKTFNNDDRLAPSHGHSYDGDYESGLNQFFFFFFFFSFFSYFCNAKFVKNSIFPSSGDASLASRIGSQTKLAPIANLALYSFAFIISGTVIERYREELSMEKPTPWRIRCDIN